MTKNLTVKQLIKLLITARVLSGRYGYLGISPEIQKSVIENVKGIVSCKWIEETEEIEIVNISDFDPDTGDLINTRRTCKPDEVPKELLVSLYEQYYEVALTKMKDELLTKLAKEELKQQGLI